MLRAVGCALTGFRFLSLSRALVLVCGTEVQLLTQAPSDVVRVKHKMSTPYTYQTGNALSATLKRTLHRVRMARPDRYTSRFVKEQHMGEDGYTTTVTVRAEPDAKPMTPRERHQFAHSRPGRYYF